MEKIIFSAEHVGTPQESIMIVDDALENLYVLEAILKEAGYCIRSVPDGSLALESVQNILPDLILLDIMMPGLDGFEVCRRLKADERTRGIPVIFLSAMREQAHKITAFQVGGIDYITKPFQVEEVLARVRTHLTLQRMHRQLEERNEALVQTNERLALEITERRRAEDDLQRSYDELEERVAQRTAELADSNEALLESERVAREFQEKLKALHEIGVELSEAVNVDEICRKSIELGRSALGFDRLGLFLLGESENTVEGTFGTDLQGKLRDERGQRSTISQDSLFAKVLKAEEPVAVWQDTPLFDDGKEFGRGWNAMATLWGEECVIGWLTTDNLIVHKPLAPYELELLSLFASTIGHLITRKQAEEKLGQLKQALEFLQIGVTITDLDGGIVYTNRAEAEMHGYQEEELLGRPSNFFAPEEFRVPVALRDIERWDGLVRESLNLRKNGTTFPVRLMSEVVRGPDGRPCALITSCEDISEQKALAEEREQYRNHLELLVKERTAELMATNTQLRQEISERQRAEQELVHANEAALEAKHAAETAQYKAESANRAKSQFLASMNHELRTPLNSILGFSQLLTHSSHLDSEQQEHIKIINRNGEHLLTLINQVLDLSKIEADRMELESRDFDLHHLLDELESMFRLRAEKKHLQLAFRRNPDVSRYLRADEVKLRQVLLNLLSNAIKFTEKGGVRLSVSNSRGTATREQSSEEVDHQALNAGDRLKFTVEDTGQGIAPDELDNLFEAFVQTRSGLRSQEGTGLGLTICQRFVQLMGGTIDVSSESGSGTIFTVVLPVEVLNVDKTELRGSTRRLVALEPNQPRCRILLVDDDPDSRRLLVNILTPFGFDIQEAGDGRVGFELWERWKPHLIFMDMRMPLLDGYETTRLIRAQEAEYHTFHRTSIIAITARTSEEERAEIFAAGCDDFIAKPLREADIFELMRQHLHLRLIYEGENRQKSSSRQGAVPLEALAALPDELLGNLKQVALRLNIGMIGRTIQLIQAHDENLAAALANLADDFKYDRILACIKDAEDLKTSV